MTGEITLVSWNVYQGLLDDPGPSPRRRNPQIEDHLRGVDADILVLPEAWRFHDPQATWAEDLAASLGYELHQWIADGPSRPKDIVPWRMVILTRLSARRLDDYVFPAHGPLGARAMVRVELAESGLRIAGGHLYGIHWAFHRCLAGWRSERRALRDVALSHDIIAGDLNIWSPIVKRDARNLTAAVRGRTFPASRPHSQIDHILVSDRLRVVRSDVLPNMGSDHLGLKMTFVPNTNPTPTTH